MGFPSGSAVKNSPANAGDTDLIPGWGRSPEEVNYNPHLGNPINRGAWPSTESQRIRHNVATKQQPQQAAMGNVSCHSTLQNGIIYLTKPILGLKCLKTLTGKAKAHILMCNYHLNPSWKQKICKNQ